MVKEVYFKSYEGRGVRRFNNMIDGFILRVTSALLGSSHSPRLDYILRTLELQIFFQLI